ncbi:MAG: Anti-sigma factor RskA [Actinomycetia bacterium]|nr:Anti-sigma factor RskA [Actinomycetes bacterium]
MADDVHELSALYALDVLSDDERTQFEQHLEDCDRCRAEIDGLRTAASSLAFAVEGPPPPAELRARVLAAARADGQNVLPFRPRRSFAVSLVAAAAVAASAAAVALGVWAASLDKSLSHERATLSILTDPAARHVPLKGARGELVVAPSGDAVLSVQLPKPPNGKTYEAWVADPSVRPAGVFAGRTTKLLVRVRRGAQVMVSVEPAGGVDAPTTTPIVSARA